jgi:hypothetical protein
MKYSKANKRLSVSTLPGSPCFIRQLTAVLVHSLITAEYFPAKQDIAEVKRLWFTRSWDKQPSSLPPALVFLNLQVRPIASDAGFERFWCTPQEKDGRKFDHESLIGRANLALPPTMGLALPWPA